MRRILSITLFCIVILSIAGCRQSQLIYEETDTYIYLKTDTYEGVILTVEGTECWMPDQQTIVDFEESLTPFIKRFKCGEGNTIDCSDLKFVRKHLNEYKRQYIGTFEDGKKILYCNFLILHDDDEFDWKTKYIFMLDGGASYFQMKYDIDNNELYDFSINGYA